MKKQRLDRVNSLLKEVISEAIHKDVSNPHVTSFVTVTRVETSADLHRAKVFVSILAPANEKEKILSALQISSGFIAVTASKKVQLRYFPHLIFILDTAIDKYMKIENILQKVEKERLSRPSLDDPMSDIPLPL